MGDLILGQPMANERYVNRSVDVESGPPRAAPLSITEFHG